MKPTLSREDIIRGLSELVSELSNNETSVDIYVIGGAALSLRYFDRRLTSDIDLRARDFSLLEAAAQTVAARNGWDNDWLNAAATQFVPSLGANVAWECLFESEGVRIFVASPEAMLVMKLAASRIGRDDADIANLLAITGLTDLQSIEELFEDYFPGDVLPQKAYRILNKIFEIGIPDVPVEPCRPEFKK